MAEDESKKEEEKFEFTPAGEALGYISLDQARVLAIQHARDNTGFYGPSYARVTLVWEVINQEETEDYYDFRLSFRPAGRFRGEPGVEQFIIDKMGNIQLRQILDEPSDLGRPARGRPRLLIGTAVGLIVIGVVAVGALFGSGIFAGSGTPTPTPAPALALAPAPTTVVEREAVVAPTQTPTPIVVERQVVVTATPGPTPTRVPTPTPVIVQREVQVVVTATPGPTATPAPTLTSVVLRVTATPVPTPTPVPAPALQVKRGGVVPMNTFESPGSDTYYGGNNADNTMTHVGPIFNQIIEYDPDTREGLDLRGGVTESWAISEDGLTYTFKLRKNMKFHDGTPLEMKDVLFTLVTAFTPDEIEFEDVRDEIQGRTLGNAQTVRIYMKDWEAVDEDTLAFHLNFPSNAFLTSFAIYRFPVISKDAIAEHGTFRVPNEGTLVGTGPWMFVKYDKDIVTELERNPDYHLEGRPYLDTLLQFPIFDIGTIIAAFKTEQVLLSGDYISNLTISDAVKLQEEMGDKLRLIFASAPPFSMGVMMNAKAKPFDDPRARKAMNLILHRQPLIETLSEGKNKMGTPFPCGFAWGFTCEEALQMPGMRELNGEKHPDDIAEAQRLMIEAGAGPGTKMEFTCRLVIEYCDMMLLIQSQLQKWLGWEISTRSLESTAGYDLYRAGKYQFAVQAIGFSFPDPDATASAYRKNSTSHTQRTFYYNEEAEPLWEVINR